MTEKLNVIQQKESEKQYENACVIWLSGGCFWGTQQYISAINGVLDTDVGYANGIKPSPTYEEVCTGKTGYAEAVRVVYDPTILSLSFLLDLYYKSINPTSLNRQGDDMGEQYCTGIYYSDNADSVIIYNSLNILAKIHDKPIAIEVNPIINYFLAEDFHQNYLKNNPDGYCHISSAQMDYAKTAKNYQKPTDLFLKENLSPLQYDVTQNSATEIPFENEYDKTFEQGIYVDITTGEPMFLSCDKFNSGCGWPAFSHPINQSLIKTLPDTTRGRVRTEVRTQNSDSHLGHVFEDGPEETGGLRYCINSSSLLFIPKNQLEEKGYGNLLPLL